MFLKQCSVILCRHIQIHHAIQGLLCLFYHLMPGKKEGSSELAFLFQFLPVLSRVTGFIWHEGHMWEWDENKKTSKLKAVNSIAGRVYFKYCLSYCYWQVTIYQGWVNEWQEKDEIAGTGYTSVLWSIPVLIHSLHAKRTLGGWKESLIYEDQNGSMQKEKIIYKCP